MVQPASMAVPRTERRTDDPPVFVFRHEEQARIACREGVKSRVPVADQPETDVAPERAQGVAIIGAVDTDCRHRRSVLDRRSVLAVSRQLCSSCS